MVGAEASADLRPAIGKERGHVPVVLDTPDRLRVQARDRPVDRRARPRPVAGARVGRRRIVQRGQPPCFTGNLVAERVVAGNQREGKCRLGQEGRQPTSEVLAERPSTIRGHQDDTTVATRFTERGPMPIAAALRKYRCRVMACPSRPTGPLQKSAIRPAGCARAELPYACR
jgi:hypothetical protein